jgi:hypothetical protein
VECWVRVERVSAKSPTSRKECEKWGTPGTRLIARHVDSHGDGHGRNIAACSAFSFQRSTTRVVRYADSVYFTRILPSAYALG